MHILNSIYMYAYYSIAPLQAFTNFILHKRTFQSFGSNQDYCYRGSFKLLINPLMNSRISLSLNLLKICLINEASSFFTLSNPTIADNH